MKNPSLVSAKYCERALLVLSVICVLLFAGCSSIDGTAENHKVTANLVTSHVEQAQEEPENQAVPELSMAGCAAGSPGRTSALKPRPGDAQIGKASYNQSTLGFEKPWPFGVEPGAGVNTDN